MRRTQQSQLTQDGTKLTAVVVFMLFPLPRRLFLLLSLANSSCSSKHGFLTIWARKTFLQGTWAAIRTSHLGLLSPEYMSNRVSQVALVVKNLSANAEDTGVV